MQVFQSLEQFEEYFGPAGASGADRPKTVVALGNFDGVHIGHVEIIRSAVSYARETGAVPVCYTFSNHPRNMHIDIEGGEEPNAWGGPRRPARPRRAVCCPLQGTASGSVSDIHSYIITLPGCQLSIAGSRNSAAFR